MQEKYLGIKFHWLKVRVVGSEWVPPRMEGVVIAQGAEDFYYFFGDKDTLAMVRNQHCRGCKLGKLRRQPVDECWTRWQEYYCEPLVPRDPTGRRQCYLNEETG